jgi:hypothetical protein
MHHIFEIGSSTPWPVRGGFGNRGHKTVWRSPFVFARARIFIVEVL